MGAGDVYTGCLKAINGVFMLLGLFLLALSGYMFYGKEDLFNIHITYIQSPWLPMGVGLFLLMVSSFGCCGAVQAKRAHGFNCWLAVYFVIVFVLFAFQIFLAIKIALELGYISDARLAPAFNQSSLEINTLVTEAITYNPNTISAWTDIEDNLKCCGYYTYNDTFAYDAKTCAGDNTTVVEGCQDQVFSFLTTGGYYSYAVIGSVCFIQLCALIASMCLCCCKPSYASDERAMLMKSSQRGYNPHGYNNNVPYNA